MAFELPNLGYAYDALEPNIDAKTMEIHHSKHHNGYTTKLNGAIAGTDLEGKSIEDILNTLDMSNGAVRNNGGGFYNHSLFWTVINPSNKGELSGDLKNAIMEAFGSFDAFLDLLMLLKILFQTLQQLSLDLAGHGYVFFQEEK